MTSEKTPLISAASKWRKVRGLLKTTSAMKRRSTNYSLFGDGGVGADGSVDVFGAEVALSTAAVDQMSPVDKIAFVRRFSAIDVLAATLSAQEDAEAAGERSWGRLEIGACAQGLGTDLQKGLSSEDAAMRLERDGPNALTPPEGTPFYQLLLKQFTNIVILLIMFGGILKAASAPKERTSGIVMFIAGIVMAVLNAVGEATCSEGATALQALGAEEATVIRDGEESEIPAKNLVRGDLVVLKSGDCCPADLRVIQSSDLETDESLLTGEPEPAAKASGPSREDVPFPTSMAYASTGVVQGKGKGIVTAVGMRAQVGLIAAKLEPGGVGLTPLQKLTNKMGGSCGVCTIAVVVVATLACFFQRYNDPSDPCQADDTGCFLLNSLSRGILLGVSCVPTTLPVMMTMLLLLARRRIVARHALVRKASAIETLGSCTAICSDKTGTLTEGRMAATAIATGRAQVRRYRISPTEGYSPFGKVYGDDQPDGTRNYAEGNDEEATFVRALLTAGALSSYQTKLTQEDGRWVCGGNMSEAALVVAAAKAGIGNVASLPCEDPLEKYPIVCEVPFTSGRKMSVTVHKVAQGKFAGLDLGHGNDHVAVVKGAPDRLLPLISRSWRGVEIQSGFDPAQMREANDSFASGALRVLLVCATPMTAAAAEEAALLPVNERAKRLTDGMACLGAFGLLDPPRAAVRPAVETCREAGVRVVMITGDQPATATAIARNLGILSEMDEARMCTDLYKGDELLDEKAIETLVAATGAWARAQPSDKVTIVEALQRMGHTAAMTGDGVNDAPALKAADIGTAMGVAGSAVAKGSADVVLLDDNFATIVGAVEEGRRAYAAIQVYVAYYVAAVVGEVLSYIVCIAVRLPLPVEGLQIIMLAGAAHIFPPFALVWHPSAEESMRVPPRRKDAKLLPWLTLKWLVLPWALIWALTWVSMTAMSFQMRIGHTSADAITSTTFNAVEEEIAACEVAGTVDADGRYVRDPFPFHCVCSVQSTFLSKAEKVTEWGVPHVDEPSEAWRESMGQCDGKWAGHWCWGEDAPTKKPLLETNCALRGAREARGMTLYAAVVAELLFLLSISYPEPFVMKLNANTGLVGLCLGLLALGLVLMETPLAGVVGVDRPPPGAMLSAIVLSLGAVALVELGKVGYRRELEGFYEVRRAHAAGLAAGLLEPWSTDEEVKALMDMGGRASDV